jgi:hypothetical protein
MWEVNERLVFRLWLEGGKHTFTLARCLMARAARLKMPGIK